MDKLKEILLAVKSKSSLTPELTHWPAIRLISYKTFDHTQYEKIRWFQLMVTEFFSVKLVAIGGGYGCTKITFAVEAGTQEEAQSFILNIMGSEEFRRLGVEAEFRVAISDSPYIRNDLKTGEQELSLEAKKQQSINIYAKEVTLMKNSKNQVKIEGGVSNSNLAIGSEKNTLQLNHQPENSAILELLQQIHDTVSNDQDLGNTQRQDALDIIQAAKDEAKKEEPKKSLLKTFAESLKSVKSIGSSVTKLFGLLGLGV